MPKILFIRGLNTYADEMQRLGPFRFGEISAPLHAAFRLAGADFLNVPNMGAGTLTEHIEAAAREIQKLPAWQKNQKFHILSHSIGGLIGRALVHRPEMGERLLSVTSIGTPHDGAEMAEIAATLRNRRPWLQKVLKACDYDTGRRAECLDSLTREAVARFNEQTPDREEIAYLSAVCALPRHLQALPFRVLHLQMPEFLQLEESDGVIPAQSQRHGRVLGYYQLDHMMEVGYCLDFRPSIRRNFQTEFHRMVADIAQFYQGFGRVPHL